MDKHAVSIAERVVRSRITRDIAQTGRKSRDGWWSRAAP
jgi:hypothetical protein